MKLRETEKKREYQRTVRRREQKARKREGRERAHVGARVVLRTKETPDKA